MTASTYFVIIHLMKTNIRLRSIEVLFLSLAFLGLNGCNKTASIHEDGYFRYIYLGENSRFQNKNDKSIVIVGFTELGLKQERLDIPKEIGGFQVKYLGLRDEGIDHNNNREIICSSNLKKIFVFDTLERIDCFEGPNVDIMLCSNKYELTISNTFKHLYLYAPLFQEKGYVPSDKDDKTIQSANISFLLNNNVKDNSDLYRIDNVSSNEKIVMPPNPSRGDFLFTGWYTEPECLNAWDFNSALTIEKNNEFVLYAGWNNL